ncbi:Phage protein GP46 [compost metagenome]
MLAREKQTPQTLSRAEQYSREALDWMIQDQIASRIECAAAYVATGWMAIAVDIYRPTGDRIQYRYHYEWAAQAAKRAA